MNKHLSAAPKRKISRWGQFLQRMVEGLQAARSKFTAEADGGKWREFARI
jgi:hypothetical protein